MAKTELRAIQGSSSGYYALLGLLGLVLAIGLASAWHMEHEGHYVTGMSNQIVWGMPHVFAVFLILAASGALNVASLSSVFGKAEYKPLAPLSGLLAITLLIGGLAVLVLDLGRPDRLIVAMTRYNFKSIFTWNVFLYVGFVALVAVYLWFLLEQRMNRYGARVGVAAFVWRLVLTTGTGSIFGFLVARQAYDAAIMAPLFVAMSLAYGGAAFVLAWLAGLRGAGRALDTALLGRLARLLGMFVAAVLYLTAVQHLTNLYAAEHGGVERFILWEGGSISVLFWLGQVVAGGIAPLALLLHSGTSARSGWVAVASALVVLGGLAQLYVIIIGGQLYPLILFPGLEETSSFGDGAIARYAASAPELGLGLGGVALALAGFVLAIKLLPILPERVTVGAPDASPD